MRSLILGKLNNDNRLIALKKRVEVASKKLIKDNDAKTDILFLSQVSTDDERGVEYETHDNYIKLILSETNQPSQKDIESSIRDAVLDYEHRSLVDAGAI